MLPKLFAESVSKSALKTPHTFPVVPPPHTRRGGSRDLVDDGQG